MLLFWTYYRCTNIKNKTIDNNIYSKCIWIVGVFVYTETGEVHFDKSTFIEIASNVHPTSTNLIFDMCKNYFTKYIFCAIYSFQCRSSSLLLTPILRLLAVFAYYSRAKTWQMRLSFFLSKACPEMRLPA